VRVGRAALDEEAIRLIEEHHPQIHFDWPQILKGEEEAAPPEPWRREAGERQPVVPPPPAAAVASPAAQATPQETPLPETAPQEAGSLEVEPVNPAHARLGSEGLARLRARYADVAATISRRVQDEARRQQLTEQAERLNPDTWVTDEEVSRGLEDYETVLASLRDVVGRRRRRKRSRPGSPAGPPREQPAAGEPAGDQDGPMPDQGDESADEE
jgi:hypothetical protein